MPTAITFIGLGVMGHPMAGHLAHQDSYDVTVYNRTPEKAQQWTAQHPGTSTETIAEAVKGADVIISCVGADPDLQNIYCSDSGIIANAPSGALLIDHTTASAGIAQKLAAQAAGRGLLWLDAPVSGGQRGAENGALTIMCGGDARAFTRARPIMDCYAKAMNLMGEAGSGQLTKMVNQIMVAGLLQSLSEGIHFAETSGLEVEKVIDVISQGAAQSWQMDNRADTMINGEYNHGFAVDWMRKDLAICLQEARDRGASLPASALIDQFYGDVQALGGGRWDTSSLLQRLRHLRKS